MLQDEVMEQAFVTLNIDCSTQSPGEKPLILTWERSPGWDEEPVHVSVWSSDADHTKDLNATCSTKMPSRLSQNTKNLEDLLEKKPELAMTVTGQAHSFPDDISGCS